MARSAIFFPILCASQCFVLVLGVAAGGAAQTSGSIGNSALTVAVRAQDGSYEVLIPGWRSPVLISRVGAQVDRRWIWSTDYPKHNVSESTFQDALGLGRKLEVTFNGLADQPAIVCDLRVYDARPYGDIEVRVENATGKNLTVQSIRLVDAEGTPRIDLGGREASDRVMAEVFSEGPTIPIGDLAQAPHGDYQGIRDILVHNRESARNLLLAALTENRWVTIAHLRVAGERSETPAIGSFTMDSTGATEVATQYDRLAPQQQVELSLPLANGAALASERVMIAAGPDFLGELTTYGEAVKILHHALVTRPAPMGWWSWTAFYGGITAGEVLTNIDWLARHLKSLGYDYFHIDEGYEYARGEYATLNAAQFPQGMRGIGDAIRKHGLTFGIWAGPFLVSSHAWVYEHHQDWLVKDAQGKPMGLDSPHPETQDYVLDTTNPGAQAYLRQTYRTMTQDWGVRYIKLDFMEKTAVEGYRYRPNTTALEAERIGIETIRNAVGNDVLIDKDESAMLLPVGLVNEGRIGGDDAHSFRASKENAPNIAARFYMNRNFYVNDPDAFCVSRPINPQESWYRQGSSTLDEAQVQIVLAAVAGGMYEIGDDLPTLGAEPGRLALVTNPELIAMNRLGRAALPLDLMTFPAEDEQPSVFFLREDRRQAMLAVFNWTEQARSHAFTLAELSMPNDHPIQAFDVMNHDASVEIAGDTLKIQNQPPHSVRLIKLVDSTLPAAGPSVAAQVPETARAGQSVRCAATVDASAVPAIGFEWDFGDGTQARGADVQHTFTFPGSFTIHLTVAGVEGVGTRQTLTVEVAGFPSTGSNPAANRRYVEAGK